MADNTKATPNTAERDKENTENEQQSEGLLPLTQDAIEWDETKSVDLRNLAAKSPFLSKTPARVSTTTTPLEGIRRSARRHQPSSSSSGPKTQPPSTASNGSAKGKKSKYSPGQELEGILGVLHNHDGDTTAGGAHSAPTPEAATQKRNNLKRSTTYPPATKASSSIGMRHRRKRRDEGGLNNADQQQQRKRRVAPGGRPSSAGSIVEGSTRMNNGGTKTSTFDKDTVFEDLLKQLDDPVPARNRKGNVRKSPSLRRAVPSSKRVGQSQRRASQQVTPSGTTNTPSLQAQRAVSATRGGAPSARPVQTNAATSQPQQQVNPVQSSQSRPSSSHGQTLGPVSQGATLQRPSSSSGRPSAVMMHQAKRQPMLPNQTKPQHAQPSQPVSIPSSRVLAGPKQPVRPTKLDNQSLPQSSHAPGPRAQPPAPANKPSEAPKNDEFDDGFEFSQSDLAALDALMVQATQSMGTTKGQSRESSAKGSSVMQQKEVQPIASVQTRAPAASKAVASSVVAPKPSKQQQQQPKKDSMGDDDFDFPMMDFDFEAMDKQIAQRSTSSNQERLLTASPAPNRKPGMDVPPSNAPVINKLSFDFHPQKSRISFSRYIVVSVVDDTHTYTKILAVKAWSDEMLDRLRDTSIHRPQGVGLNRKQLKDESANGVVFLRGEWYHSHVEQGDVVHICSLSGRYNTTVDSLPITLHTTAPAGSDQNDDLVIIVHPDMLITPTIISETVSCSRRAILRSRLGSTGLSSKAALYGTMRHELFEQCMSDQDFSIKASRGYVRSATRKSAQSLVALGIKDAEAQKEVLRVLPQLQQFAVDYTGFGLSASPSLTQAGKIGKQLEGSGALSDVPFLAEGVHATEESLLSPELGLKGNVDVTAKVKTGASAPAMLSGIELKTGHNQNTQNAHMAQLALYALMLRVRHGSGPGGASGLGMLLYMNHEGLRGVGVSPRNNELKSLVGQRNVVASELRRAARPRGVTLSEQSPDSDEPSYSIQISPAPPSSLPDVLASSHSCTKCYANRECMMYAAADLAPPTDQSVVSVDKSHNRILQHFTGHLEQGDFEYFREWDRLIDIEADASLHMTTVSWLSKASEREKLSGASISSLVIDLTGISHPDLAQSPDGGSVSAVMRRSGDSPLTTGFIRLSVEPGSHVIISTDTTTLCQQDGGRRTKQLGRKQMQVARGTVEKLDDDGITVRFSPQEIKQILLFVDQQNQSSPLKFRLDKDEVSTGIGTLRQNLINLFTADVGAFENKSADPRLSQGTLVRNRFSRLRDIVVRLKPPVCTSHSIDTIFTKLPNSRGTSPALPGCSFGRLKAEFETLNEDQKKAVHQVFNATDCSLIQGMPGTGKTSTIAFVARLLAAHGKRVLITSYTHAAVDNLMVKLMDKGLASSQGSSSTSRLVRLGYKTSCHPGVHSILVSEIASGLETDGSEALPSADTLHSVMSAARIVGVSALTIPRSPLMVGQNFDVVIVDEAGQISQPAILGPLMAADSFVLVGDHMQLPPLVTSEAAEKGGFGISMMKRLADRFPDNVAQLTFQYRMQEKICQLSNEIVYGGKLRCATEEVSKQKLALTGFPSALPASDRWLTNVINPGRPVVFVNTDPTAAQGAGVSPSLSTTLERSLGTRGKGNVVNDMEAKLVSKVVHGLLLCGVPASSIGIISPFRAQLRLFDEDPQMAEWKASGLEASTIDRYQGRDKEVIIISFVRSNNKGKSGRLLEDFRRLNVAVSRAKKKLVMVGSVSTLHKGSDVLRPILDGLRQRNQLQSLPEHASLQ